MKKIISKKAWISSILSFVIVFCIAFQSQVFAESAQTDPFSSNYKVVTNNDQVLEIQTEIPNDDTSLGDSSSTKVDKSKDKKPEKSIIYIRHLIFRIEDISVQLWQRAFH
ncbi:hypothetical protein [Paenibacillus sp. URB8-2]|uniref:hypothetical protein n=1 Tax=Paenibacillus sp. URB8-2 TaxID=2741301 RepID=UPI0015BA4404|nr:hypothetical protein [Paenibacillus sp. URB8-2]BCG60071.1 hypothetical protein PUR_34960 [Paenibacillus sp. URB8-2]